jgi:hypothetical protein
MSNGKLPGWPGMNLFLKPGQRQRRILEEVKTDLRSWGRRELVRIEAGAPLLHKVHRIVRRHRWEE